jgi:hypothetical protein
MGKPMNDKQKAENGAINENLLADIADDVHIASTHPESGVCHGDNDGCEGGPGRLDHEIADRIYDRIERVFRPASTPEEGQ